MAKCHLGYDISVYNGHGCWCAVNDGIKKKSVDAIDECCALHEKCYVNSSCKNVLQKFLFYPYNWTCDGINYKAYEKIKRGKAYVTLPKSRPTIKCTSVNVGCKKDMCNCDNAEKDVHRLPITADSLSWAITVGPARLGRHGWAGTVGPARLGRHGWAGTVGPSRLGRHGWAGTVGPARLGRHVWAGTVGPSRLGRHGWAGTRKVSALLWLKIGEDQTEQLDFCEEKNETDFGIANLFNDN
ncbi:hypothetical protein niasHT_019437 [Heterodera trifolii]|uniref:Phospholipase A2-like central domain-containing protein n=1 Tax=Heterodera trifolii TaxID=157864 RepID=A0ABD2KVR4_9BILA